MVSEFGKELRKIRIDNGEVLKDMAEKLNVTSAYLSAIENGKREVPQDYVQKISSIYNLDSGKAEILQSAYEASLKKIVINFPNARPCKRNLALKFARTFEEMPDEKAEKILKYMEREI